jgi:hypothetical protein
MIKQRIPYPDLPLPPEVKVLANRVKKITAINHPPVAATGVIRPVALKIPVVKPTPVALPQRPKLTPKPVVKPEPLPQELPVVEEVKYPEQPIQKATPDREHNGVKDMGSYLVEPIEWDT